MTIWPSFSSKGEPGDLFAVQGAEPGAGQPGHRQQPQPGNLIFTF